LGVDFGKRRIGLAIAAGGLAEPLLIVDSAAAILKIAKICKEEKIEQIVLGLPLSSNGELGPMAKSAKSFGQKLGRATGLDIVFWDETLTSREALGKMTEAGRPQKKRRHLDDAAAALLLQEYLDAGSDE